MKSILISLCLLSTSTFAQNSEPICVMPICQVSYSKPLEQWGISKDGHYLKFYAGTEQGRQDAIIGAKKLDAGKACVFLE